MRHSTLVLLLLAAALSAAQGKTVRLTDYASRRTGDDWAPALREALQEADTVLVPAGTYPLSETRIPSGKSIIGDRRKTVFKALSSSLFRAEGSIGKEIPLTEDLPDFSSEIQVEDASPFAAGDLLLLRSQRNCMVREDCGDWTLGQTAARKKTCFYGEFLTVSSVEDHTLKITTRTVFPFYRKDCSAETFREGFATRSASTVQRVQPVRNVFLSGFDVAGGKDCCSIIRFSYACNCTAEDITVVNPEPLSSSSMLFVMSRCVDCTIRKCNSICTEAMRTAVLNDLEKVYDNYSKYNNFRIISCRGCTFEGCSDNFATHAFSITYSGLPSTHCRIIGCRSLNSIWAGIIAQQNTPWSELVANTVLQSGQGVFAGCRWSKVANNYVRTELPHDTNYYYTHLSRGGTVGIAVFEGYARECVVTGNTVSGFYTGIAVLDGYEQRNIFDGKSDLVIENNSVSACITGFSIYKNKYNTDRTYLGITLRDNEFIGLGETFGLGGEERSGFGARLPRSMGVRLVGNSFSNFKFGIHMNGFPDGIHIVANRVGHCRYGIFLSTENDNPNRLESHLEIRDNHFEEIGLKEFSGLFQPFVILVK